MVVAAFVAPFLLEATTRFIQAAARLPGVQLALVTSEPEDQIPAELRVTLAAHWRVDDALDPGQLAGAVQAIGGYLGPVRRLLAVLEQLQVPLAQVRERLGIEGTDVATARNFRDKAQMKTVLRGARVPRARHRLADPAAAALGFAEEVGFPLVVKPPAGAGAKSTFRLDDADDLHVWLEAAPPTPGRLALLEEFLSGEEGSYDSVMVDGNVVWHSVSSYFPTPLEVLRNLAYTAFPPTHWKKIWSTNPLERLNKEFKRRCDVVGVFPTPRPATPVRRGPARTTRRMARQRPPLPVRSLYDRPDRHPHQEPGPTQHRPTDGMMRTH